MDQLNIFDYITEDYKITKPIRLIELFAGIGSQAKALERLGANFEHYRVVEFDKYAIKSYNAIHGTEFETSDVTKITAKDLGIEDTEHYEYILTYSFPCQDLSLAGKQQGMEKGSGTRSGLLWEVERLLNECDELPQVLLMENVTQVHGKKNMEHFKQWITALENLGYSNYWQDLNAKSYGIPQNRNRTFMISILGDYTYKFPEPFELKLRLKDMLEDEVDEKYFLSEKMIKYISATGTENFSNSDCKINLDIARPLTTDQNKRAGTTNYLSEDLPSNYDLNLKLKDRLEDEASANIKEVMNLYEMGIKQYNRRTGSVVDTDAISSTLLARTQGDNNLLLIKNATKKGYLEAEEGDGIDISSRMQHHRGTVQKGMIQTLDTQATKGVVVRGKNDK